MGAGDTSEAGAGPGTDNPAALKSKRSKIQLANAAKDKPPIVETKRKVHAQRKFAQGAGSLTNSPHSSPLKELSSRVRPRDTGSTSSSSSSGPTILQKGERPKTEDFLTFLCLRGTEYLPPELGFFNQVSHFNNAGTSNDSFSDTDEDATSNLELKKKGGVAKKSSRKQLNKDKKSLNTTPNSKTKEHVKRDLSATSSNRVSNRAPSQDSASSVDRKSGKAKDKIPREKKCEVRLTRSKLSPKTKAAVSSKKSSRESERERRARLREVVKEKEEEEKGDSSEEDWSEEEGEQEAEGDKEKSETEVDADEEASSRESSRRPTTRRSQGVSKALSASKEDPQTDSKEELLSISASRPSRKTKEAAKSYLNLLGQKLAGKKRDEENEVPLRLHASPEPEPARSSIERQTSTNRKQEKESSKESVDDVKEEEIKVEEDDSGSESLSKVDEEDKSSSNGSKSPRGSKLKDSDKDLRKERKEKRKSKTSLKDFQNILLEEAKRKISDTLTGTKSSNSPADSDSTPDSDDRITISQRTGYINVKPRQSIETIEDSDPPAGPQPSSSARRNSLSNSTNNRLSAATKPERTVTPPRKILPKSDESDRGSVESLNSINNKPTLPVPASLVTAAAQLAQATGSAGAGVPGGTGAGHLPAGVAGAAGISSRNLQPSSTPSKLTSTPNTPPVVLNTPSVARPLSIQTIQQDVKPSIPLTIPGSVSYQPPATQTNSTVSQGYQPGVNQPVHLNVPDPSRSQAILYPPQSQQNQVRMPIQMPGIPIQVQGMAPAGLQSVQVGVRQPSGAVAYQTIPVIGPGGVQYSIPVHSMPTAGGSMAMPVHSLQPGTLPVQTGPISVQPLQPGQLAPGSVIPVGNVQHQQPTSVDTSGMGVVGRHLNPAIVTVPSYVRPSGYVSYAQATAQSYVQQPPVMGTPMTAATHPETSLAQTITMPSGTTIQYNVTAVPVQPGSEPGPVTCVAGTTTSPASTVSTPSLISPGPPVLSPQIAKPLPQARTNHSKKVLKNEFGPPLLTPPTRKKSESRANKDPGSTSSLNSSHQQPLEICVDDDSPPTTPLAVNPPTYAAPQQQLPTTTTTTSTQRSDSPTKSSTSTVVRTTTGNQYNPGYSQYPPVTVHQPAPSYHSPLHVDPYHSPQQQQQAVGVYETSPYHHNSPVAPQPYATSPHHQGGSGTHAMASPHHQQHQGSPHQMQANIVSPHHQHPSPHHHQVSPHHANTMASPNHSQVSPHHSMTMGSPHHPNTMGSPHHPNTLGSPHHPNTMASPHHPNQMGSPHHPNPMSSPHHPNTGMVSPSQQAYSGQYHSAQYQGYTHSYPAGVYNYPSQPSTQYPPPVPQQPQISQAAPIQQLVTAPDQAQQLTEVNEAGWLAEGSSPRTSTVEQATSTVPSHTTASPRTSSVQSGSSGTQHIRKQQGTDLNQVVKQENVSKQKVDSELSDSTKHLDNKNKSDQKSGAQTKKRTEKFGKSKTTSITHKPITQFNVDDDKSSPYAFDFESSDPSPQNMPFRKSSSPLKPTTIFKKSKASLSGFISDPSTSGTPTPQPQQSSSTHNHPDTSSTSKSLFSRGETSRIMTSFNLAESGGSKRRSGSRSSSISVGGADSANARDDKKSADNTEDGSSSDNETTYFIPLETEGQSFGVAVKLGTDGPSGPNQKVIMTAKLVTNPDKKPVNAKILGSKTIESKVKISDGGCKESPHASSAHTTSTPRKGRMPVASPVSPVYPLDEHISPIQDKIKPSRIRRADDAIPSTSQARDPGSARRALHSHSTAESSAHNIPTAAGSGLSSGPPNRRPKCLIGAVHTGKQFPRLGQHAQMMQAPIFRPTEAEFKDPLQYIMRIRKHAEPFGMCKIVPPKSFKPECNVEDELRFTAYNQYINRMYNRWGPNAKETAAIKKYLDTQNVDTRAHPLVGGLEVDLPALYHAVQSFGGLSEVIQKKKWNKIAEYLRVSRGTHASGNKLDDIYVKWLLPYDTLSAVEREELLRLVEEEWSEQSRDKLQKSRQQDEAGDKNSDEDEDDDDEDEEQEAVVKGKSTSLAAFYRLSRNLLTTVFRDVENPSPHDVEDEYWKIVAERDVHLQVCQGSIDTGLVDGYGFPIRNSVYSSHPWNLKNLSKNSRSVLQALGNVMGVTVPTLHVSMLLTTSCWYRDPHALPWIEYLHTGSSKIWYGIPDHHSLAFYTAMKQLVPRFCKNRKIWLPSDTVMVSPSLLVKHGVSVSRTVQHPGQFIIIFPKSYTSSISAGYSVSESVYFATSDWLQEIDTVFQDIRDSMEPMMFPPEKMLISVAKFKAATKRVLLNVKTKIEIMNIRELSWRDKITAAGIKKLERLKLEGEAGEEDDEYECHVCNANLYLSMIANEDEDLTFCLPHGLQHIKSNKKRLRQSKLMYLLTREELKEVVTNLTNRINSNNYAMEPQPDAPLKASDLENIDAVDDTGEEGIDSAESTEPRQRALPSFIKKEMASSSEETDGDEDTEGDVEEVQGSTQERTIGPEDYTHFQDVDEEDIPLVEALFMENDEIIRPSERRQKPRWRKPPSESEDTSEEEGGEEEGDNDESTEKEKDKNAPKPRKSANAQPKKPANNTNNSNNKASTNKKQGLQTNIIANKRKRNNSKSSIEEIDITEAPKKKIDYKSKEAPTAAKTGKRASDDAAKNKVGFKRRDSNSSLQPAAKKGKVADNKILPAADVRSSTPKTKTEVTKTALEASKNKKSMNQAAPSSSKAQNIAASKKKPLIINKKKEALTAKKQKDESSAKKKEELAAKKREEVSTRRRDDAVAATNNKKRRSKKRKAKTIDSADKFNLLDIILTETDDEMPVSMSEEGSESSSSEDEWK